jgi:hypothetical protein
MVINACLVHSCFLIHLLHESNKWYDRSPRVIMMKTIIKVNAGVRDNLAERKDCYDTWHVTNVEACRSSIEYLEYDSI